jgi:hypothetical protein
LPFLEDFSKLFPLTMPMWRNGRRGRFKICSEQSGAGSSPVIGNKKEA